MNIEAAKLIFSLLPRQQPTIYFLKPKITQLKKIKTNNNKYEIILMHKTDKKTQQQYLQFKLNLKWKQKSYE